MNRALGLSCREDIQCSPRLLLISAEKIVIVHCYVFDGTKDTLTLRYHLEISEEKSKFTEKQKKKKKHQKMAVENPRWITLTINLI